MRPKRTIKPTLIFDNSISITSKNKNKQKIETKKNKVVSDTIDSASKVLGKDCVNSTEDMGMDGELDNESVGGTEENREDDIADDNGERCSTRNDQDVSKNGDTISDLDLNQVKEGINRNNRSYASATMGNNEEYSRNLFVKPTETDENGNEYEGLEDVVNCGPWMVRNKPFFVQKWNIHVCLDKREHNQVPVWIRLCNVPLEAWTKNGISALASRLRKPLIMDKVTAEKCKSGMGRVGYAQKELPNEIDVVYRGKEQEELCRKKVQVKFDWIPVRCASCCVFGHDNLVCGKMKDQTRDDAEVSRAINATRGEQVAEKPRNDGFTEIRYRKVNGVGNKPVHKNNFQPQRQEAKKGKTETQFVFKRKENAVNVKTKELNKAQNDKGKSPKSTKPSNDEIKDWNVDMCNYFKQRWKMLIGKEKDNNQMEQDDVYSEDDGISKGWNKDVINLTIIHEEGQSIFCLVETINGQFKSYYTIVYAANSGCERKDLWNELHRHKQIANGMPWFIGGDFNVTLKVAEHSSGSSVMSADMHDFNDCINQIELEDISSTGLNFTWTKNLMKVKQGDFSGILKKLDRLMINESFIKMFPGAHAIFMPYLIS
ncbi:RNA-directed DNA polymerase, eukaryota, reverse transcriptase zinc-binding domain protein [Tanacetum coccineum]